MMTRSFPVSAKDEESKGDLDPGAPGRGNVVARKTFRGEEDEQARANVAPLGDICHTTMNASTGVLCKVGRFDATPNSVVGHLASNRTLRAVSHSGLPDTDVLETTEHVPRRVTRTSTTTTRPSERDMQTQEWLTPPETLGDALARATRRHGDKTAFTYSRDGEEESARITYRQLDHRARAIGSALRHRDTAAGRALVLCPSGLDFIAAIFGCFYAGTVAIPLHPPVHTRLMSRVTSIMADAQTDFVLTTAAVQSELKPVIDEMPGGALLQWCAVDADVAYDDTAEPVFPEIASDATAFVQYTSGSTGTPKGVQLTHANLLANLEDMHRLVKGDEVRLASWLPLHHDMGLIGATFEVVYAGGTGFLMPPSAFIQRPMRWLETISRYRANVSVAPNFAYDLCVERSTVEDRTRLDLSPWTFALSGAEPVRAATIERFADAFAPAGFRQKAFLPVYGLAEATLLVSGETNRNAAPIVRRIDRIALRENRVTSVPSDHPSAMSIVGCGPAADSQEIIIVDPVTRNRCTPDEVGEIWIAGPNVALGYWGRAAETEETFAAQTSDADAGRYLRTGDLGFLDADGELFVTGRLKDVVIIRGRNYHPSDIEFTVQETHPGLLNGRGAAFSVFPESGPEQLVVVQEVDRQQIADADAEKVMATIRAAITADHQIRPHAILLVTVLGIPTTSSGKIRRRACKQEFIDGRLEAFAQWRVPEHPQPVTAPVAEPLEQSRRSAKDIEAWLVEQLAADLGMAPTEIDTTQPFAYYGLDSVRSMQLMMVLETWIGREISPTLGYTYPTIQMLADHLAADADTAHPVEEVREPEVRLAAALIRADHRERQRLLIAYLCDHVAAQIDMVPSHLDIKLPLISFGIDSLMAAELRAQIECEIGITVPLAELLDGPSVVDLANRLATTLSESGQDKSNGTAPTNRDGASADLAAEASGLGEAHWGSVLAQVAEASDDDVDVLLREILKVGEANND